MTTKKSIILSFATALTMGAQYMNDAAACTAMADIEAELGEKTIRMDAKPMPADIEALLRQTEVSTGGTKKVKPLSNSPRGGEK